MMRPDDPLRELRADLYRPGADAAALHRYEAARETMRESAFDRKAEAPAAVPRGRHLPRTAAAIVGTVLVLVAIAVLYGMTAHPVAAVPILARGTRSAASAPDWSPWPPTASEQQAELSAAVRRPAQFPRLLQRRPDLLPGVSRIVTSASGRSARPLQLDSFGAAVGASSEVLVVWQCDQGGRRYRLQLSTLVQNDTSIVLAPLTVLTGACSGVPQMVRYRPILGMVPTAAELRAPGGASVAVLLVEQG